MKHKRNQQQDQTSSTSIIQFKNPNYCFCNFDALNFGDTIGPDLVHAITKRYFNDDYSIRLPICGYSRRSANTTCIWHVGSVVRMGKDGDHFWGSGINIQHLHHIAKNLTFYAVRGEKTYTTIKERSNQTIVPEVFGDPAILLPILNITQNKWCNTNCLLLRRYPVILVMEMFLKIISVLMESINSGFASKHTTNTLCFIASTLRADEKINLSLYAMQSTNWKEVIMTF